MYHDRGWDESQKRASCEDNGVVSILLTFGTLREAEGNRGEKPRTRNPEFERAWHLEVLNENCNPVAALCALTLTGRTALTAEGTAIDKVSSACQLVGGGNDHRIHIITFQDSPRIGGGEDLGSALIESARVCRQTEVDAPG
jgi:hypothetical protein